MNVKTHVGEMLVDPCDSACINCSGFMSGEKLLTCFGEEVMVAGVAPGPKGSKFVGQEMLWYTKSDGFTYSFKPGNLRGYGFERLAFREEARF